MVSERALSNYATDQSGGIVVHPLRTLLYELLVEPVAELSQRVWRVLGLTEDPVTKAGVPVLLTDPTGPAGLQSHRSLPKP